MGSLQRCGHRRGGRNSIPRGRSPAGVAPRFPPFGIPDILRPVSLSSSPEVAPIAPIERFLDCRHRFSMIMAPLAPAWGITFRRSHGMTCGAGCDAERVVAHSTGPSFAKSHPVGIYEAFSRAKSAGRCAFGEPGSGPPVPYLPPLCIRERILIRVDNQITAGRDRAVRRPEKLASDTKARRPNMLQEYGDLAEWAGNRFLMKNRTSSSARAIRKHYPAEKGAESTQAYVATRRPRERRPGKYSTPGALHIWGAKGRPRLAGCALPIRLRPGGGDMGGWLTYAHRPMGGRR